MKLFGRFNLRWRLVLYFLPLIVLPAMVIIYFQSQEWIEDTRQSVDAVEEANLEARTLLMNAFLAELETDLRVLSQLPAVTELATGILNGDAELTAFAAERLPRGFSSVMQREYYNQIRFIGPDGMEMARINYDGAELWITAPEDLQDKSGRSYVDGGDGTGGVMNMPEGGIYISALDLNREGSPAEIQVLPDGSVVPVLRLGMPIYIDGQLGGAIVTNVFAQSFLDIAAPTGADSHVYLVNQDGYFLHNSANPELTFGFEPGIEAVGGVPGASLENDPVFTGGDAGTLFSTYDAASVDHADSHASMNGWLLHYERIAPPSAPAGYYWTLVIARDESVVFAEVQDIQLIGAGVTLVLALFGLGATVFVAQQITTPVTDLSQRAGLIAQGDFSASVDREVTLRGDEIGQLGRAFDTMQAQLQTTIGSLEERVQARTRDLEIAADISQEVAAAPTYQQMLKRFVQLTRERFDLYHAHVYVVDDRRENLVLAAGADERGERMVQAGHTIPLNHAHSLVARCARERQPVIVSDVTQDPDFLRNRLLPKTTAEMAIPMVAEGRVIGVLDVQSTEVGRFTEEDARVKTTMAGQIAVAVRNARAFQEAERARSEVARLYSTSIDMMGTANFEGYFISVNPAFERVLGYTPDEMMSRPFIDFVHPDDRPHTEAESAKIADGADTLHFENRYQHREGHWVWISWTSSVDTANGQIHFVARDITEQKHATLAMEQQSTIIDNSDDFIALTTMEGEITYINPGGAKMMGLVSPQAAIGTRIPDYHTPQGTKFVLEKGIPTILERGTWRSENELLTRDGQLIPVEQTLFLVRDKDGNAASIGTIMTDITERKLAAQQVEIYADVMQNAPGGIHVWRLEDPDDDTSLRFIVGNEASKQATGVDPTEIAMKTMREAFPELMQTAIPALYAGIARGGDPVDLGEVEYSDDNIKKSVFYVRAFPLPDRSVGVSFEEVTERVQTEKQTKLLSGINAALSQATDEQAILAAVADLANEYGASMSTLTYYVGDDSDGLGLAEVVAAQDGTGNAIPLSVFPNTTYYRHDFPLIDIVASQPDDVTLVSGWENPDVPQTARDFMRASNFQTSAILPLKIGEHWQGMLGLIWEEETDLPNELTSLLRAVMPTAASVVASRRAYLDAQTAREDAAKRAAELQTVAEVSTEAAVNLDVSDLLWSVSGVTRDAFKLYHAHIYLLNDTGDTLELVAGAGEAGRAMVAEGRTIPLNRRDSLVATAARNRRGLIVNDVTQNPSFLPHPMLPDTKSEMAIPMVVGQNLVGVLDVQADVTDRFTEEDVQVKSTLAAQIAVAVTNARSYQQTQTLFQTSRALVEAEDMDAMLAAAAAPVLEQSGADVTLLQSAFDDDGNIIGMSIQSRIHSGELPVAASPIGTVYPLQAFPLVGELVEHPGDILTVPDVDNDPEGRIKPALRELLNQGGIKALAVVPLQTPDHRLIGCMAFSWAQPGTFTQAQQELYNLIAPQMATLIDNTDLYRRTEQALQETETHSQRLALLNELSQQLETANDDDAVFALTSIMMTKVFQDHRSTVTLHEPATNTLAITALKGVEGTLATGVSLPVQGTSIGICFTENRLVINPDLSRETHGHKDLEGLAKQGIRSTMSAPLVVEGEVIGTLNTASLEPEAFGTAEQVVFQQIATLISGRLENRRAFQRVERSQALMTNLINSIPDLIFYKDVDGVYLGANNAFAGLVNRPVDQIVAHTDYDLFPQDVADFFRENDSVMMANRESRSNEEWLDFPDGRHLLYDTLKTPLYGPDGETIGLLGISRDITDRKEQQEAMDRQRRLLDAIVNNIPSGIFVVEAPSGKPIFSNERAEEMLGRGISPDADQDHLSEVYAAYKEGTDELYPTAELPVVRGLQGESATIDDMLVVKPGGERLLLEVSGAPMRDDNDEIIASVISFQDITDRRRSQERARRLGQINAALSRSDDEQDILSAVAELANEYGAHLSTLTYYVGADDPLDVAEVVAGQFGDGSPLPLEMLPSTTIYREVFPIIDFLATRTEGPTAVRITDDFVNDDVRNYMQGAGFQSSLLVPLLQGDRWLGILSFTWQENVEIPDELMEVTTAIMPNATSVVASRRAYLDAEKARIQSVKRAAELATVARVSTEAATNQNVDDLLWEVSNLTRDAFGLYHAHIYLLNEAGDTLELVAGAGEAGRTMVAENRTIPFDRQDSLVATAARNRQGVIVNDVTQNPNFLPHPMLPDTKSEMAIPMIVGSNLVGVLDVQANRTNRFTDEDVQVKTTLASQIAVAVQNARAFSEVERAHAETQRLYTSSIDMMGTANFEGYFTTVNPAFERILGYTPEEMMAQPFIDLVHPEDRPATEAESARIADGADTLQFTNRYKAKDGRWVWMSWTSAVDLANGQIHFVARDITEEREREEAMDRQRRLLDAIVNNIPSGIFVVEAPSGKPIFSNERAEDMLGRGISPDADQDDLSEVYAAYKEGTGELYPTGELPVVRGLQGESSVIDDMLVIKPSGERLLLEVSGAPMRDDRDEIIASVISFQDITERKASEREQAMLSQVNASLSQSDDEVDILAAVSDIAVDYGVAMSTLSYFTELDEQGQPEVAEVVAASGGDGQPIPLHVFPATTLHRDQFPVIDFVARNRSDIAVINSRDDEWIPADMRAFMEASGFSGSILIPLYAGDRWLGSLSFNWAQDMDFPPELLSMTQAIQSTMSSVVASRRAYLEAQVAREEAARRAGELQTVAEVSVATTTILNIDELLQAVADLTRDAFGLYHAHIYLVDHEEERLVLAGGAGEAGRMMKAAGHSIPVDSATSLVARAARTGEGVIVNDVTQGEGFLPNPRLPQTRAEMAIPMVVGGEVIGVLDVQANTRGRFNEADLALKTTLASLVAVAVRNAQAYTEMEEQAVRERAVAEQLREFDRLKQQFLANMSHELRTPLNSIIGYSEVLLDGVDGDLTEDAEEDVEAIHNSGKHLLSIINEILDLAKIEANEMQLDIRPVDLPEFAREIVRAAQPLIKDKPVTIEMTQAADIPTVAADPVRLRQIIWNLMSNAVKFTEEGVVRLQLDRTADGMALVTVEDSGIGMRQEDLDKIYDRFSQVDGSSTRRAGGTGLGLTITRQLIEMHGGEIEVSSIYGEGTTFTFTLPIYAAEEA